MLKQFFFIVVVIMISSSSAFRINRKLNTFAKRSFTAMKNPQVYFDIDIGGTQSGRITFELFADVVCILFNASFILNVTNMMQQLIELTYTFQA
jgi:hypothetical protein